MSYQAYLSQAQCKQSRQSDQYCTRFGFIILILFAFLCCFSKISSAQTSACHVQIIQSEIAKAVAQHQNQRPTAGWIKLNGFPDLVDNHWAKYTGSVWYKIRWRYDCPTTAQHPLSIVINRMTLAGQLYLNDDLLWQDESLVEPLSRSWNMPRYWNIPLSHLRSGENILWIRVVAVASQTSGLGQVFIGPTQEMMPYYQDFWYKQRVLIFFNLIFSLTIGIVAFLVWLFHRKDSAFGWFSLCSLCWVLIMGNTILNTPPLGLNTLVIARINAMVIFAYSILSCFYAWRIAQTHFPRIEKFLWLLLAVLLILSIITPDHHIHVFLMSSFVMAVSILIMLFMTYPIIAYRSQKIEASMLAAVFMIYLIVVLHDTALILHPHVGNPISPYTAPLTMLLIAIILAMRLARNIQRIEQFNKTLEQKVIQAKDELAHSMTTQHQLELDNTKLQERMNLAHDLHDGLGASLVRSMALVDQSQQPLSNQQFLSMLKVLRDDLRYIIDVGSSCASKIPATPAIWGAPIRYRFMQIFDELEIESTWVFPETWQYQPTPLQCLTLLRVIEESLTNVIKHSQAPAVKITLAYQVQQLILSIEDDGIGFDVDAVMQSGMSIGLRSMQTRMQKIHATMSILSQSGKTRIQVTIEMLC